MASKKSAHKTKPMAKGKTDSLASEIMAGVRSSRKVVTSLNAAVLAARQPRSCA